MSEATPTTRPFVNLNAIYDALASKLTHAVSITTVLFKFTWNKGIIIGDVGARLFYIGVPYRLPVVSGIGLAVRGKIWSSHSQAPSVYFSAHSRRTIRSLGEGLRDDIYRHVLLQQKTTLDTIQLGSKMRICQYMW